jgi:phosphoglycolate phosphatase
MVRALVFDFDGTLVDSIGSIWVEYQRVMKVMGLPRVTHREFTRHIGRMWSDVIKSLWPDVDPQEFTRHYRLQAESVTPIEGVDDALNQLSKDYTLAIMTARGEKTLNIHMKNTGVDEDIFEAVYNRDNLEHNKPDPRAMLAVCRGLGIESGEAIYIGDSVVDAECALNAGAGFVAVLTGGAHAEDFRRMGVEGILESVAELPSYLKQGGY